MLLLLMGCAAMVRSWSFAAPPVESPAIAIMIQDAAIQQRTAHLWFTIENRSETQREIRIDQVQMSTPWGEPLEGAINPRIPGFEEIWRDRSVEGALPPGGWLTIEVVFRQYGHDLRRHPGYEVRLIGLSIDGGPATVPPIRLSAPEGAPMGEDI